MYLSDSGLVTGTATTEGIYDDIEVEVKDSSTPQKSHKKFIVVTVYQPTEELSIINNSNLIAAKVNTYYEVQFRASGGNNTSYTWAVEAGSAPLPGGLTLDPNTGILSGMPTASAGTQFSFSIQVTDGDGDTVAKAFVLNVN